jgi:thiamine biosynthesis lipoprotein
MAGRALLVAALALSLVAAAAAPPPALEFRFRRDHLLGTSFDLTVLAADLDHAEKCERTVLAEIERLRRILSAWDPASEISLLNASSQAVPASPELLDVLRLGEEWRARSGGAFNMDLQAGSTGLPAVEIDPAGGTARRITSRPLTVNAVAKGYIIEKAIAAARRADPTLLRILLDIGGDIGTWGSGTWKIGLADPLRSQENVPPGEEILLGGGRAIATSAFYERGPHIFDPRTGRPAQGVLSATAIAADVPTANALSTILCVLGPEEGLRFAARMAGTECLVIDSDGTRHSSPGWAAIATSRVQAAAQNANWPDKYQLTIDLALAENPPGRKYRRPYVAVWIEDAQKKPVRTITVWGTADKYLKDLTEWWAFGGKDKDLVKAVTRATRNGGKYSLAWDGLDDKGNSVPRGTYTVRVEVHREHGNHIKDMAGTIECGDKPQATEIKGNLEVDGIKLTYAPPGK